MITHTLTITSIKTTNEYPDYTDCVKNIEWSMVLSNGTDNITRIGGVNISPPDSSDYTPLSDLTEKQVLEWVENRITKDGLLDTLKRDAQKIFDAKDEPILSKVSLPWEE